jgi:hypothetical protein
VGKPDRWKAQFQLTSKRGLPRTKVAMDEMSCRHQIKQSFYAWLQELISATESATLFDMAQLTD